MFVLLYYVAVLLISMMATFAMFSDGHTTRDASKEEDEDGLGFFSSSSSSSSSTPRLFEVGVPAPKDSALERLRASITSDSQREQLSFLEQHCCVLPTRAKDVEVLHQPCDFLSELQKQIRNAQRSIIISALYVGDGPLSRSFVAALEEKVEERMAAYTQQQQRNDDVVELELEPLHITILLDYNRMHDRRNLVTLRTLLHRAHEAELRQLPIHVHLHLFQSPCRWNRIFALFGRAKEALGVQHTKIFCFDDQHTILTGANLSDDYFSTRMDRYVVLKHNKCVAVWFRQLVERLVECSHPVMCRDTYRIQFDDEKEEQVMQESNARQRGREALRMVCEMVLPRGDATTTTTTTSSSSSPTSPTSPTLHARSNLIILPNALGADPSVDANAFVAKTREVMKRFARDVSLQFSGVAYTSFTRNNNNNNHDDDDDDEYDSVFFPTLQVGRGGVHHDGLIVQGVLQRLQATQQLFLTSPYLNLYSAFTDEVLRGRSTVHVITASVRTNGWHGQKGMAGWIPFFYLQLERAFFFLMEANACLHRVHLHEFHVDGLTYHAKGLWLAQTTTTTPPTTTTKTSTSNTCPKEMKKDDDDDDDDVYVATPYLVAYGSTNYGYRSVHKDVEAEGFLYTSNQHLRDVFREELQFLLAKSEHVATNKFVHGAKGRFQPIVSLVAQLGQDFL